MSPASAAEIAPESHAQSGHTVDILFSDTATRLLASDASDTHPSSVINDGENFILAHDQQVIAVNLDLGAGV